MSVRSCVSRAERLVPFYIDLVLTRPSASRRREPEKSLGRLAGGTPHQVG